MEENSDLENIDELSRSVIEPFEMNPPDGTWDSLDAALTKKQAIIYKKRAYRFQLLSITLALLLFSFIMFHYFSPTQNTNRGGGVIDKTLTGNYKAEHSGINSGNSPKNSGSSQNLSGEISFPRQDSESGTTYENSAAGEKEKKPASNHDNNNNGVIQKTEVQLAANEVERTGKKENYKLTSDEKQDMTTDDESINVETDSGRFAENAVVNESLVISHDSQKKDLKETESTPVISDVLIGSQIPTGDTVIYEEPVFTKIDPASKNSRDDSAVSKANRVMSRISLAVLYAPCYVGYHLEDNDPNDAEEASEYQSREQSEYSFATGLLLGYDVSKHWSILSGCTFSTAEYSMTYSTIYMKYGWDNQLHIQYPTSSGIIEVPNSGNNSWNEGDSLNVEVFCDQLVKFVNVPLTARYQVKKQRVTWYADAGLTANFIVQELVKVSFGTFNKTIYNNVDGLKKINFGFVAGIGSQFNFNNGMAFFIEPVFKGSITSLTYNTALNCYPYSIGLNTGLSIHF